MVVDVVDEGAVRNFRLVTRSLAVRLEVDLVLFHLYLIAFLRLTT